MIILIVYLLGVVIGLIYSRVVHLRGPEYYDMVMDDKWEDKMTGTILYALFWPGWIVGYFIYHCIILQIDKHICKPLVKFNLKSVAKSILEDKK